MPHHPTVFIGLGEKGVEIARYASGAVLESHASLEPYLSTLQLTAEGFHPHRAEEDGGEAVWDTPLASDLSPGVWAQNYEALGGQRRKMRRVLERGIRTVRQIHQLGDEPARVGSDLNILLVSALASPVGSAAVLPILKQVRRLTKNVFPSLQHRVQLILLAPDLVPHQKESELAQARGYVTLQELEYAFNRHADAGLLPEVGFIWLLSSQNEDNLFVDSYRDLLPVISHYAETAVTGQAMQDQSFGVALQQQIDGCKKRYSSFGHARLEFPRERLVEAAAYCALHEVLHDLPALERKQVEAGTAYSHVRQFIQEEEWDHLPRQLEVDVNGQDIWQPFAPPAEVRQERDPERFLQKVTRYAGAYDQAEVNEMQRAVSERRTHLVDEQRRAILQRVSEFLDQEEPGGLAKAQAWLAALEGKPSEYIHGDTESFPMTLQDVDERVKAYFDKLFESILFPDNDPEIEAYIQAHEGVPRKRRDLLKRLEHDLSTKQRNLEERKRQLRQLEEEREELKKQIPDEPAPEETGEAATSGVDSDGEAEQDSSASEQASSVTAASREDADDEMYTGAVADEEVRAAQVTATRRQEMEELERLIGERESDVEAFESEVEDLQQLVERVSAQVAHLDRVVEDASERRRLLDPMLQEYREAIDEAKGEYRSAAQKESRRRAELRKKEEERGKWLTWALAIPLVVCLIWAGTSWYWDLWSQDWFWPALSTTLLLSLGAGGIVYWVNYGRPRKELEEAVARQRERKNRRKRAIIRRYNQLFKTQYEHWRRGSLVDWRSGVARFLKELREQLKTFESELDQLAVQSADKAEDVEPSERLFINYVVPEEGAKALVRSRASRVEQEVKRLWDDFPLSKAFQEMRRQRAKTLAGFREEALERLSRAFSDVQEMSLEDFLREVYQDQRTIERQVQSVYASAAPLVSLGAAGTTQVASEALTYVGVETSDERDSLINESLRSLGADPICYRSKVDTQAPLLRLTIAFAGFQFTPARVGRFRVEELSSSEREGLHANPAWKEDLPDLVPSSHRLGDSSDKTRQLACLTLAYGLATPEEESSRHISFDGESFSSYDDWVRFLRRPESESIRRELWEELRALRQNGGQQALSRLESYETHPSMDAIDGQILDAEIERYYSV